MKNGPEGDAAPQPALTKATSMGVEMATKHNRAKRVK